MEGNILRELPRGSNQRTGHTHVRPSSSASVLDRCPEEAQSQTNQLLSYNSPAPRKLSSYLSPSHLAPFRPVRHSLKERRSKKWHGVLLAPAERSPFETIEDMSAALSSSCSISPILTYVWQEDGVLPLPSSLPLLPHLRDCDSSAVSHPYSSALSSPRYGRARFLMSKIWQRSRLWSVPDTGCVPLLEMSPLCVGWYLADQRTSPALLGVNYIA